MAKVITENFRVENAREFYNTFNSDSYYIIGSSYNNTDGEVTNTQNDKFNFLRRVIFGTRVVSSDLRFLFEKRLWVEDTIYDEYDDRSDVSTLNMYVTVLEGNINEGNYRVYKCIKNNNGAASTVLPSAAIFEVDEDGFFFTGDGYYWKYMFEIKPSEYTRHQTINDLPFNPVLDQDNQNIKDASNDGIYNIKVSENDVFAQNLFLPYLVGLSNIENTVQSGTGFVSRIKIDPGFNARADSNSYVGMYLVVAGSVYDIVASERPAGFTDVIEISTETNPNPTNTVLNCQILPKIKVSKSTLGESSNPEIINISPDATAHAVLDANGRIVDIQIVNFGGGYTFATAKVVLPEGLTDKEGSVTLRPIISPKGGHGSNPILELAMSNIGVVANIISSDETSIPATGTYTKVGLLRGPDFNNDVSSTTTLSGTISVLNNSTLVNGSSTFFTQQLEVNDIIVISGENYTVAQIQNDTKLSIDRVFEGQNVVGVTANRLNFPLTFDNRKILSVPGNYAASAISGYVIEQIVNPNSLNNREVLTAIINSAVYDGATNVTTIYVTDYSNDNFSDFEVGANSPLAKIKRDYITTDGINFRINSITNGEYSSLSGTLYHFANFKPITRQEDTTEKIKFIFDF